MTPEEQLEQIARFQFPDHDFDWLCADDDVSLDPVRRLYHAEKTGPGWQLVPDFLNDLNAIQKAEQRLTDGQWASCIAHLQLVVGLEHFAAMPGRAYLRATATQRAEALLKAIGKWPEPPDTNTYRFFEDVEDRLYWKVPVAVDHYFYKHRDYPERPWLKCKPRSNAAEFELKASRFKEYQPTTESETP